MFSGKCLGWDSVQTGLELRSVCVYVGVIDRAAATSRIHPEGDFRVPNTCLLRMRVGVLGGQGLVPLPGLSTITITREPLIIKRARCHQSMGLTQGELADTIIPHP